MKQPIKDGFLQNNLKGGIAPGASAVGTNYITELAGIQIINRVTRDIYIGKRSNSVAGTGDKDSPYAANTTAQFHNLMNGTTVADIIRSGAFIFIEEGEFTHYGSPAWTVLPAMKMAGKGIGATILKIEDDFSIPTNNGLNCVGTDLALDNSGAYIGYMTVDGNYDNLLNPHGGKVNGVVLYGRSNTTIERVHHTGGFGTFAAVGDGNPTQESFGIICAGVSGDTYIPHNQKIINCIAGGYKGNYGGGIIIVGRSSDNLCEGSVIEGCEVSDYIDVNHTPGANFSDSATAGIGSGGGTIRDCRINGCQRGIYNENGIDVKIHGNIISDCYEIGMHFNPSSLIDRLSVWDNTIELRDDGPRRYGIVLSDQDNDVAEVHNAKIWGNTIIVKTTGDFQNTDDRIGITMRPLYDGETFIGYVPNRNCSFFGNHIDVRLEHILPSQTISTDSFSLGNRTAKTEADEGGNTLVMLPDQLGGSGQSFEMETKVEFTPDTIDEWYTIATGTSFMAGTVRIKAVAANGYSEAEIVFDGQAYGQEGTFQQLRNSQHTNRIVDKIRMSNTNGMDGAAMQLDIHVNYLTALTGPIELYFYGPSLGTIVPTPVAGANTLDLGLVVFNLYSKGFDSSYSGPPAAVFVSEAKGSDDFGLRLVETSPFATIQAALDAAEDGDEIIIGPGVYDEEVTVRAGTFVITLQHGAIWKQSSDAACLKSADVTCDITINGDLLTEDGGAACIAMVAGCPDVVIRVNGTLDGRVGTGTSFSSTVSALFHASGKIYIKGKLLGTTSAIESANAEAGSLIDMDGDVTAYSYIAHVLNGDSDISFRNGVLTSTAGSAAFLTLNSNLNFTRSTIHAPGAIFQVGGTTVVTLHEFCHLSAGEYEGNELSTDLPEIVLDGISFTNLPKEVGTVLSGTGNLIVGYEASTGILTLS